MSSLITLILRSNLDILAVLVVGDEGGRTAEEGAEDGAADATPGVCVRVVGEGDGEGGEGVEVEGDGVVVGEVLEIIRTTRRLNDHSHFPNPHPKPIIPRHINLIRRVNNQKRRIPQTDPKRSPRQVKQGPFTCSKVLFN